jgi:hypothetical protein
MFFDTSYKRLLIRSKAILSILKQQLNPSEGGVEKLAGKVAEF